MNLLQLSIILETFGAAFISFDIFFNRCRRRELNKKIIRWLKPENYSRNAIIATLVCVLGIIVWAVVTDWQSNPPTEIGLSLLSIFTMLVGLWGGIAVPIFISQVMTFILTKIKNKFDRPKEISLPLIIYIISTATGVFGLYLFYEMAKLSFTIMMPFVLTFIFSSFFLSAWINAVPLLQKHLALEKNPVSKIGIALFLIAKVIQYSTI